MEQWYEYLQSFPKDPEVKVYLKAIQTVETIIKEDLAEFEVAYLSATVFHKPINLFEKISGSRNDDSWSHVTEKSFKLIAEIVHKYGDYVEQYLDEIVKLCQYSYAPTIKRHALSCLTTIAKCTQASVANIERLLAELQTSDTCRAPLVLLVGAMCEHHPEMVSESVEMIWRTFLKLLETKANSETIPASIVEGVCCVFKHFGMNLPTSEINDFYSTMTRLFYTNSKCEDVCLTILSNYSSLFPECLLNDGQLRSILWNKLPKSSIAIISVYGAIKDFREYQLILQKEVLPRLKASYYVERFTALRVINDLSVIQMYTDVQTYLYELRADNASPEVLEAIQVCVEMNQPDCERLLQTCVDKYDILPKSKRTVVFVHAVLNATHEIRDRVIKYLISETCNPNQGEDARNKFYSIWSDLFDTKKGTDALVLEKSRIVYDEFMVYFLEVIHRDDLIVTPQLVLLTNLASHVIQLYDKDNTWYSHAIKTTVCLDAVRMFTNACLDSSVVDLNKILDIRRCSDEAALCECCLAVVTAPCEAGLSDGTVLEALQILFSTNTVNEGSLLLALKKMEAIMFTNNKELNQKTINDVIYKISKIENRKDLIGKEGRILRREVSMFLAKFHDVSTVYNALNDKDNLLLSTADDLSLTVHNSIDGRDCKINLKPMLHTALVEGEPTVLKSLLAIVCSGTSETHVRLAATISTSLCSCHVRGESVDTPLSRVHSDALNDVLEYLSEQKSPGLRRMLSDGVEDILTSSGLESAPLLQVVVEHVRVMLAAEKVETIRAGLDLSKTLISVLNQTQNHTMITQTLPELIVLITKTSENETCNLTEEAFNTFIEELELFNQDAIENMIKQIKTNLLDRDLSNRLCQSTNVKVFKQMARQFACLVKNVYERQDVGERERVFNDLSGGFIENRIYIIAVVREVFEFDSEQCNGVVSKDDYALLEEILSYELRNKDYFSFECILKFFSQFASTLLEYRYQDTILRFREIIHLISPRVILNTNETFKKCLTVFKSELNTLPQNLVASIEEFINSLNLDALTHALADGDIHDDSEMTVTAVKIVFECVEHDDDSAFVGIRKILREWSKIMLRLFASGRVKDDLKFKMALMTDVVKLSLSFLTADEIKRLISQAGVAGLPNEKIGLDFCRCFMAAFYRFLLRKPFILLDEDMQDCCILLNDIVKQNIKLSCPEEDCVLILELADKLWPVYSNHSTPLQNYDLLLSLRAFPTCLGPESNPVRWAVETVCSGEHVDLLLGVLPQGRSYDECYARITSDMPLRLSEMDTRWRSTFVAMLECLSNTADLKLMGIVAKFAAGDPTFGWWDDSFCTCAISLAKRNDIELLDQIYQICKELASLKLVERLMLPVLRYSSPATTGAFFEHHLPNLLTIISQSPTGCDGRYKRAVVESTMAVLIVTVAFEKPLTTIGWEVGRDVCKRCVAVRDSLRKRIDNNAIEERRSLQAACYTAIAGALVRWRRFDSRVDKFVCSEDAFSGLVADVELPIQPFPLRTRRHVTCSSRDVTVESMTSRSTLRTRPFIRTLAENPLMYDLTEDTPVESEVQEIKLADSPLNNHECAAAMTAVICQLSKQASRDWLRSLAAALTGDMRKQDKWLVCQIVCNLKEQLSQFASTLRPALLDVVAKADEQALNAVHIYILDTISFWPPDEDLTSISENLNLTFSHLISTCLLNANKIYLFQCIDNILEKFLKSFGKYLVVNEDMSAKLVTTMQASHKNHTKLISRLLQHNISIPAMLPAYTQLMCQSKWSAMDCKLFALLKPSDVELGKFRSKLESLRRSNVAEYVRQLYYVQMQCGRCCDDHNFRMISELVPKIVGDIKKKCLHIISSYVSTHTNDYVQDMFEAVEICEILLTDYVIDALQVVIKGHRQMPAAVKSRAISVISDLCQNANVKVREGAFEAAKSMLEDALARDAIEPPSKRAKLSTSPAKVIELSNRLDVGRIVSCVSVGTTDRVEGIASMCRDSLAAVLSDDLSLRFTECVYLVLHLPSKHRKRHQVEVCAGAAAILEMLLRGVRRTDAWARQSIEMPKSQNRQEATSKLLTMSRTYQGTFTKTVASDKKITTKRTDLPEEPTSIPSETILASLLDFASANTQAALNLITSVARAVIPVTEGFDMWGGEMNRLMLCVCRAGYVCEGLLPQVSKLRELTTSTEGYHLVNLLYEELSIKYHDHSQFILGDFNMSMELDDLKAANVADDNFSLKKLTSAFKQLSNWDDLTIQKQNNIRYSQLPTLWTSKEEFVSNLKNYTGTNDWFRVMSDSCLERERVNVLNLMNDINSWPRRTFVVSALSEAANWLTNRQFDIDCSQYKSFEIPRGDCLVEWAARLMLRSIYLQRQGSEETALSRSHELIWCKRASEMALPDIVKQCVDRNSRDEWNESEVLPWLQQRLLSELNAAEANNTDVARRALIKLETTAPNFVEASRTEDLIDINTLTLQLMDICGDVSQQKVKNLVDHTNLLLPSDTNTHIYSITAKENAKKFYEYAIVSFGKIEHKDSNDKIVGKFTEISVIIKKIFDLNILKQKHVSFLLMMLDKLKQGLNEDLAKQVLNELQSLLPHLKAPSLIQIKRHLALLSAQLASFPALSAVIHEVTAVSRASLCLQLVGDARFSLRQLCEELLECLDKDDIKNWREIFTRMKRRIFENPYIGTDYQLLKKYKKQLYEIQDLIETDKAKALTILHTTISSLSKHTTQNALRLSQLCPYLRSDRVCDDTELRTLLGGKPVFRFDEQVQVYTDSLRQPCVLRAVFSDGTSKCYIHKSGERLRRDASANTVLEAMVEDGVPIRTYKVTVLDEDSALIDRLENHQRLGTFIPGTDELLASLISDPRPANNLLILSPTASLVNHHVRLLEKIPADALRSAIERNSSCVEDFLLKKRNFQETLAAMTIVTWILGLGDRHLNNILYSCCDGGVVSVDWGPLLWGARGEPAPARLTRGMLAVGGSGVLESRLQKILSFLRTSPNKELFLGLVECSFCWVEPELKEKLAYIHGILNGCLLSHHITMDVFEKSSMEHKEKYIELIRKVFENYTQKDTYSVEDQVTCLLRHCTSHEILGVMRREWEPWV